MTSVLFFLVVVLILGVLGVFATELGADSRDGIGDTHAPRGL